MTTKEFLDHVQSMVDRSVKGHCCSKACSHCCSEALYTDTREADYMLEGLTAEQRATVAERTKEWVKRAQPLLHANMPDGFAWRRLNNPCPFLEGNLCSVYERRPAGCRTFFAHGNPDDCKMPAREHQKIAVYVDREMAWLMAPFFQDQTRVEMDHLGCILSERLLGTHPESGSHTVYEISHEPALP